MLAYLIGIALILFAAFIPFDFLTPMKHIVVQVGIAIIIVGLVIYEPIVGLLFGIAAIVAYARIHAAILGPMVGLRPGSVDYITPFVTAQNLKDAQNNVVDEKEFETPITGIKGVYGEPVYSTQGIVVKS
jgi:hypothetical protein